MIVIPFPIAYKEAHLSDGLYMEAHCEDLINQRSCAQNQPQKGMYKTSWVWRWRPWWLPGPTFFIKPRLKYPEPLTQTSSRCSSRLLSIFYPSSSVCRFCQFWAWWFLKFSLKLVNHFPFFFFSPWEKSLYDQLCEVTKKTDRDQETQVSLIPITNPRVRHGEKTEMKGMECLKVCLSMGPLTSGGSLLS